MTEYYTHILAYIHDTGFGDFARDSSPGLLELLKQEGIEGGLIVDLGSGSGIWAEELVVKGYDVIGVDISASFIQLAKGRVPKATFYNQSFFDFQFPKCHAVTSISECFNYLFDEQNSLKELIELFKRVYSALLPGGVFIFDILDTSLLQELTAEKLKDKEVVGEDWRVHVTKEIDTENERITRNISSYRRDKDSWNRSEEDHRVQLYNKDDIKKHLEWIGFEVEYLNGYGQVIFENGHTGFMAKKMK